MIVFDRIPLPGVGGTSCGKHECGGCGLLGAPDVNPWLSVTCSHSHLGWCLFSAQRPALASRQASTWFLEPVDLYVALHTSVCDSNPDLCHRVRADTTAPAHANSFNDATSGGNAGCNDFIGFTAVPGWDPVTGWGSPNFRILSQIVADLP